MPDAQVMVDLDGNNAKAGITGFCRGERIVRLDKMKRALADGGAAAKASEFVVYRKVGHALHVDYRASDAKRAADDGWKMAVA